MKKIEIDSCYIQLEDLQDNTDNPHSQRIKGAIFDGLCEPEIIKNFTPGNEIRVTGILKEVPIIKGGKKSVFLNWIFEIVDVELIDKEVDVTAFDDETITQIKELANKIDKDGFEVLDNSFAPEVYGYEKIKQAIMLQLANRRNQVKIKSTRNKSNILLIGDPGIAKTVLCKYAVKCSSGAREAVGGGSSAVGITASVVKEEDSMGGFRVEPGAMILAKDLLFLDELNNLNEEDKPKLQEGMSEQRVSINKANLHVQMKVTCGILAVANPIHGHFRTDVKESLAEQFNIPIPILNRFDTVFMMRDEVNGESDKKIAERMMQRHTGNLSPDYDFEFLKKYFAYVRYSEEPKIEEDVAELMKEIYSIVRKSHGNVKINPRFFESLTRMSSAAAKMRLSKVVDKKDIEVALGILSQSQYGIDELMIKSNIKNQP
jgi:replicative DNA helicase Mcm